MKKTTTLLLILVFALTACAPKADEPVSFTPLPSPVEQNGYMPQPSDSSMMRGNAFLDAKELLTLESFPLQFMLHLTGSLPTPCNQLRVAVRTPDSENKILMDVYSVSVSDAICVQVLEPFEVNIPLGSFPTGHYTVWVNGKQVSELDS
jgi:hypothetical protein